MKNSRKEDTTTLNIFHVILIVVLFALLYMGYRSIIADSIMDDDDYRKGNNIQNRQDAEDAAEDIIIDHN